MGVVVEGPHFSVHVDPLQGVMPVVGVPQQRDEVALQDLTGQRAFHG